jgi:carbon monoxide dehydrogenase subunit G
VGLAGRVAANGLVRFAVAGEAGTNINYTADIALTGRLGGLGEPAFRSVTAKYAQQFGQNLKNAIEHDRSETRA